MPSIKLHHKVSIDILNIVKKGLLVRDEHRIQNSQAIEQRKISPALITCKS